MDEDQPGSDGMVAQIGAQLFKRYFPWIFTGAGMSCLVLFRIASASDGFLGLSAQAAEMLFCRLVGICLMSSGIALIGVRRWVSSHLSVTTGSNLSAAGRLYMDTFAKLIPWKMRKTADGNYEYRWYSLYFYGIILLCAGLIFLGLRPPYLGLHASYMRSMQK